MTNWNALPGDIYIYVYIFGIIFKIENNKCNGFINKKKKKNASQRTHPYFSFKLLSQIFRRHFRYELFGFGFSTFSNTFYSILYTEWNIRLILPRLIDLSPRNKGRNYYSYCYFERGNRRRRRQIIIDSEILRQKSRHVIILRGLCTVVSHRFLLNSVKVWRDGY